MLEPTENENLRCLMRESQSTMDGKPTLRTTCHPCGWKRTLGVAPQHTIGQPSHRSTVAPRTTRSEKRHGRTTRAPQCLQRSQAPAHQRPVGLAANYSGGAPEMDQGNSGPSARPTPLQRLLLLAPWSGLISVVVPCSFHLWPTPPTENRPPLASSFSSNPILAGSFVNPVNGIVFLLLLYIFVFCNPPPFGSSASLFQLISVQSFTPPTSLPYQTRPTPPTTSLSEVPSQAFTNRLLAISSPWHFNGPSLILLYTGAPIDYHETQLSLSSS